MARPRKRVRLEDGLKLDVNKLVRDGFWPRGNEPLTFSTQWTSNHRGVITNAQSTIQKEGEDRASLRIVVVGKPEQRLELIAQPRHFGGKQWYFGAQSRVANVRSCGCHPARTASVAVKPGGSRSPTRRSSSQPSTAPSQRGKRSNPD